MLFRKIEKRLLEYYSNIDDMVLIVTGARQIGKTFIIRETAKNKFKHYVEINLKEDYLGNKYYSNIKTIDDFYLQVSSDFGNNLNDINDTIIFLDEIQTYPNLISLLKPLKNDNKYRYIASGSLLGITLKHIFIPMGSIQEVKMYPLDFEEFLLANGAGDNVIDYLKKCFLNNEQVKENIHESILRLFRLYLLCGGLPKAVDEFLKSKNIVKVREIQQSIYSYYKDDASQYDIANNLKIRSIYDYLPSYMENKVKRVKYNLIDSKSKFNNRFYKYADEFEYLISSGCAIASKAVSDPKYPLTESMSKNLIKLYYNDVGILTNLILKNNIQPLLNFDKGLNLGSVYETVCATELVAHGHDLYYFDSKKVGEVDFLINNYNSLSIVPIEIKSGNDQNNFRAIPKLLKNPYLLKRGYVFSNKNIIKEKDNLIYYPVYMIMFL